ncbi:MAG: hypothetical protein SXQ77_06870 [Halobacteria archaeon]|nr:hypothetical protein [Halobacteria archaeon]
MQCPGCSEEIYEEELINGNCPLCGREIQSDAGQIKEGDYGDTISEIVDFFENQSETMAINLDQQRQRERDFLLYVSPSFLDKIKPKKCDACGRWHIKFGKKEFRVKIEGSRGTVDVNYLCQLCKPNESEMEQEEE